MRWLPSASRTLRPSACTSNAVLEVRLWVIASTSSALHPAIAASSSSTGVKSGSSPPVPKKVSPPRALVALNRARPMRVISTLRRLSSVMPHSLPERGRARAWVSGGATRGATGAALLAAGDLHVAQEGTVLGRASPRVNEAEGEVQLRGHGDLSFRGLLALT